MKVLVATKFSQGERKDDFCDPRIVEGELVVLGIDHDDEKVGDKNCGCRRSLVGVQSGRRTTTMQVATFAFERSDQIEYAKIALVRMHHPEADTNENADKLAARQVTELNHAAEKFALGTVVEKRGIKFRERGAGAYHYAWFPSRNAIAVARPSGTVEIHYAQNPVRWENHMREIMSKHASADFIQVTLANFRERFDRHDMLASRV